MGSSRVTGLPLTLKDPPYSHSPHPNPLAKGLGMFPTLFMVL